MALITPAEAAKRLRITSERVRALIHAGRLPAQQYGRIYLIHEDDLALVKHRKPGRPRKLGPTKGKR
jgi:excisionase family DNA binding protein